MNFIKMQAVRLCRLLLDILEIYIPAIMLLCLFVSFIVGILYRYLLKNPQPWTFELSSISFLWFAVLSWCFVQRCDKHIVFDMLYDKMSKKNQYIMRFLGEIISCVTITLLIFASIKYIGTMSKLKTPIMKWPRWSVFLCFPVALIILDMRILHKFFIDLRSFTKIVKIVKSEELIKQ